ncbi:unnamed protein product [Gordionus sp. m RMFG-2023]|uniref:CCN family member 2-like isoform X2 n=1 Tax=Gordionus sp. m RMFG-2023 TaxID=3053472 RepID=UPI0030E2A233
MEFAVKLCFGIVLVLFNSNRLAINLFEIPDEALDCPCQQLPVKCATPPPTNCKAEVVKDACDCCHVCAKVVGEVCGAPYFEKGKCANGLICLIDLKSSESDGTCVLEFPRNLQEPCGDALQQGYCKPGLICSQLFSGTMNMCVIPPIKLPIQQTRQFVADGFDSYCPCRNLTRKCIWTPPTDCKGDLALDQCGCCYVCAKVKGELCLGPYLPLSQCSSGLLCILNNTEDPLQSKGICMTEYPREEGEPCSEEHMQGNCKKGLKCHRRHPSLMGKCVKDS